MSNETIDNRNIPSRNEIFERLKPTTKITEKLVITPLINPEKQIEEGSIDLRLGTEFILVKRAKFDSLDPLNPAHKIKKKILEYQEKMYVGIGEKIILHPQQFVLGSTFEYVKLPVDLTGYVIGRSSWGRLGLIIATATLVHPGYAGIITLELTNLGDAPIQLYPGVRIAQLVLHNVTMTPKEKEVAQKNLSKQKTKYQASVSPSFSKIHEDSEWSMIKKLKKQ
ncbi:MAG TPA: dCTP deaminase [Candidatus Nitrosotenuis sp.]|nr:dCTP deaminase [Candidatus Nitrosotenuis sp.]